MLAAIAISPKPIQSLNAASPRKTILVDKWISLSKEQPSNALFLILVTLLGRTILVIEALSLKAPLPIALTCRPSW